ncbi:hypothetical protein ACFORL_02125 [Legionella dresdenensis]|uniref:Ankyrin repeat protein n=1 Tax=Legionella dresdenensis TaxID=450200 RepID=A0ABV8CC44_9GAMM
MFDAIYQAAKNNKTSELKDQFLNYINSKPPFLTPAGQHALEGNDKAVELLRRYGACPNSIAMGYAIAGNHAKVEEYRAPPHNADKDLIAHGYAFVGNEEKVAWYRDKLKADIAFIAAGYALAGNDSKADEYFKQDKDLAHFIAAAYVSVGSDKKMKVYRDIHKADPSYIALAYATHNNHKKVEKYREKYKADVNEIVIGYALAANYDKVEEYRTKYKADVNAIAFGYALTQNHDKVEEYYSKHHACVRKIARAYSPGDMPVFYKAVYYLDKKKNNTANELIGVLIRLKNGQNSHNPYWMNSKQKLDRLVKAINKLEKDAPLSTLVQDKNSELHKALNYQRITPGWFSNARSLEKVINAAKAPEAVSRRGGKP